MWGNGLAWQRDSDGMDSSRDEAHIIEALGEDGLGLWHEDQGSLKPEDEFLVGDDVKGAEFHGSCVEL
jgi:hypothetical protein